MNATKKQQVLAIIPARGGSKGIPHKNIQHLNGKPLLAYMIEAARGSEYITRLIVSTDDPEIALVARHYGAEVVNRPASISGDEASSESALLHVLEYLETNEQYYPDLLVFLQCTAPLTASDDIDGTIRTLIDANAETAVAVVPFHYFLWEAMPDGTANGINHDKNTRFLRQNRPPQYLEAGAVYVMHAATFREIKHRFFGRTVMHVIPEDHRHEIDSPADMVVAEALLQYQQRKQLCEQLPTQIDAVVFDFDGVFTDNRVFVSQDGVESVACNRSDGIGLERLRQLKLPMVVISTERNPVVKRRCDKLQLECLYAIDDKLAALNTWLTQRGLDIAHTVYVGNDINDCECLKAVGCGVAVQDAYPEARAAAKIVLSTPGGQGAVRELADLLVARLGGQV